MWLHFFILTLSELLIQKEGKQLSQSYPMRCKIPPPPWGCAVILLSVCYWTLLWLRAKLTRLDLQVHRSLSRSCCQVTVPTFHNIFLLTTDKPAEPMTVSETQLDGFGILIFTWHILLFCTYFVEIINNFLKHNFKYHFNTNTWTL